MDPKKTRRQFLHVSAAGIAGASLAAGLGGELPAAEPKNGMPYRRFGKTDEKLSLLGVGGYHIGMCAESEAIRIIHEAIDGGVNFLDNAWEYHKGRSEERAGKAIQLPFTGQAGDP